MAVDRVDLLPLRQLAELFPRLTSGPAAPPEHGDPRRASPRPDLQARFAIAYRELLESLERTDPRLGAGGSRAPERERERLLATSPIVSGTALDVSEERERRLAELEQMRPRVFVRLQGVCEAYLPVRYLEGSVEHLALSAGCAPSRLHRRPSLNTVLLFT